MSTDTPGSVPTDVAVSQVHETASGMIQVEQSRATADVQARMAIAQRFPRNESQALVRIQNACKRWGLAAQSAYSYSRGGTTITGPSIRLVEAVAQLWGNLDFGWMELESDDSQSHVMAYCHDMETNTIHRRTVVVPHVRYSRQGGRQPLDDPRDIYETVANAAARRLRAALLACIPGDVIEMATTECRQTLLTVKESGSAHRSIEDKRRNCSMIFAGLGVSVQVLEEAIGKPMDQATAEDLMELNQRLVAHKEGAPLDDVFPSKTAESAPATKDNDQKSRVRKAAQKTTSKAKETIEGQEDTEQEGGDK